MALQRITAPFTSTLALIQACLLAVSLCPPVATATPLPAGQPAPCSLRFGQEVSRCLSPVLGVDAGQGEPLVSRARVVRHLCLQFEVSLVCLHTALTHCPGHDNVRHVQVKLGSHWAIHIRGLCVGRVASHRVPGYRLDDGSGDLLEASRRLLHEYLGDMGVEGEEEEGDDDEGDDGKDDGDGDGNQEGDDGEQGDSGDLSGAHFGHKDLVRKIEQQIIVVVPRELEQASFSRPDKVSIAGPDKASTASIDGLSKISATRPKTAYSFTGQERSSIRSPDASPGFGYNFRPHTKAMLPRRRKWRLHVRAGRVGYGRLGGSGSDGDGGGGGGKPDVTYNVLADNNGEARTTSAATSVGTSSLLQLSVVWSLLLSCPTLLLDFV